jgi:Fe-S cluster biogenesis protein NfuA
VPIDDPPDRGAVEAILNKVRPALLLDSGGVKLLTIDGWHVGLRMVGSCSSCPSKPMTQKYGIEAELHAAIGPRLVVQWH